MDTHPTPFPGNLRTAAAVPAKKARDPSKPSTQPAPPSTRPKRAFGTARSTNIPTEKPISKPLPAKPSKPLGNVIKKPSNEIPKKSSSRHVCFQEPAKETDTERTPVPSQLIEPEEATPYQTAENCSKCRFDKLEMSAYWLAQIKTAESAGKHFVSAAFFRLALECNAQPFHSLQCDLKHYVARHRSALSEAPWSDLYLGYGLSYEQSSIDPFDFDKLDAILVDGINCEKLEDECLEFDLIDNSLMYVSEKETAQLADGGDVITEGFLDVQAMTSSLKEPSFEDKMLCHEKSKPLSDKTQGSDGCNGKGRKVLNQQQAARRTAAGSKVSRSRQNSEPRQRKQEDK